MEDGEGEDEEDSAAGSLAGGVAVEGELVDGAGGDTAQSPAGGDAGNVAAEGRGRPGAHEGQQVGAEAGDVGGGHGGARDGVGGRGGADPGGEDVGAGGEDVDDAAVVGVAGDGVGRGGGADGADAGLRGGRVVGRVGAVVTGRDGQEDARADEPRRRLVEGARLAAAQRHVGHGAVGAVAALGVAGHEVDARDDARVGAGALGVQHLDGIQLGGLGDAVGRAADGAGDVGAVAVAVRVGPVGVVLQPGGAAAKLGVRRVDASVNDIRARAGSGAVVVGVAGGVAALVRDTGNAPRRVGLGHVGIDGDDRVLLNVVHLVKAVRGVLLVATAKRTLLTSGWFCNDSRAASSSLAAKPLKLLCQTCSASPGKVSRALLMDMLSDWSLNLTMYWPEMSLASRGRSTAAGPPSRLLRVAGAARAKGRRDRSVADFILMIVQENI